MDRTRAGCSLVAREATSRRKKSTQSRELARRRIVCGTGFTVLPLTRFSALLARRSEYSATKCSRESLTVRPFYRLPIPRFLKLENYFSQVHSHSEINRNVLITRFFGMPDRHFAFALVMSIARFAKKVF